MARLRHIYEQYLLPTVRGPMLSTVASAALLLGLFLTQILPVPERVDAAAATAGQRRATWQEVEPVAPLQDTTADTAQLLSSVVEQQATGVQTPVLVSARTRKVDATVYVPAVRLARASDAQAKGVAELTATVDCIWANEAAVDEQASLVAGQSLRLMEGLAEVTFSCGAKVILQGPARLEIISEKTAILHSGRLTADVPDSLIGFKVLTPMAEFRTMPVDPIEPKIQEISPAKRIEPSSR